jgi:cellulose synthase/poly-beta-1,6-N-acetylglucosamine synthase-like glycosyltransferase
MSSATGVVVIGRNEGARLMRCLSALKPLCGAIVYVDSGSRDGSPERARELGVEVVELERNRPFTAARGRNTGFARLLELHPRLESVQFIDGDCELREGWLEAGQKLLSEQPRVAAVAGRRRERHPEASAYNRIADIEWDTPIGESGGFGGDVLLRCSVFREVGGYDESLIAGEDPDLCFRIRRAGHRVLRLDEEMSLHDADMHRFGQFWQRQVRGGHAYAELLSLHGRAADPASFRSVCSIGLWGGLLPLAALAAAPFAPALTGAVAGLYLVQWLRIRARRRRISSDGAAAYASACLAGKVAELRGVLLFAWQRLVRRQDSTLIEYKGPSGEGPRPESGPTGG